MLYYTIGREKKQAEDHSLSAFDLSQLIVFPAKRRVALVPAELHLFTLRDHLSIQYPCNDLPKTVISREYSAEWKPGDEPYYPVNDEKNGKLYAEYKNLQMQNRMSSSAAVSANTSITIWMLSLPLHWQWRKKNLAEFPGHYNRNRNHPPATKTGK